MAIERYFGKGDRHLITILDGEHPEMVYDLLRSGYIEFSSAAPSPQHRWRETVWTLPLELQASENRQKAITEIELLVLKTVYALLTYADGQQNAPPKIKQLKLRWDQLIQKVGDFNGT